MGILHVLALHANGWPREKCDILVSIQIPSLYFPPHFQHNEFWQWEKVKEQLLVLSPLK